MLKTWSRPVLKQGPASRARRFTFPRQRVLKQGPVRGEKAFVEHWIDATQSHLPDVFIRRTLATRDTQALIDAIDWKKRRGSQLEALRELIEPSLRLAMEVGRADAFQLTKALAATFDLTDPRVKDYLTEHAVDLLGKQPVDELVKPLNQAIAAIYQAGLGPTDGPAFYEFRALVDGVALPERWLFATQRLGTSITQDAMAQHGVSRFYELPDDVKALVSRQSQQATEAYAARLRTAHAKQIARTEILRAQNRGRLMGWQEMAAEGVIDLEQVTKVWVAHPGACARCQAMDGTAAQVSSNFKGAEPTPPLHPSCRCTMVLQRGRPPADEEVVEVEEESVHPSLTGTAPPKLVRQSDELRQTWDDDMAELLAKDQLPDLDRQAIVDHMQGLLDDVQVRVRVTDDAMDAILTDGRIKTQFESGTSGGAFNPEHRAWSEGQLFDQPENLIPSERPVYGFMSDARTGLWTDDAYAGTGVDMYGQVELVLKDEVRDRTTVTFGDSLGDDPELPKLRSPSPATDIDETFFAPDQWGGPWGSTVEDLNYIELEDLSMFSDDVAYIEAHIHGGVSLDDIAHIRLPEVDRERLADLARQIEERGITIEWYNPLGG